MYDASRTISQPMVEGQVPTPPSAFACCSSVVLRTFLTSDRVVVFGVDRTREGRTVGTR